jgi:hypothetical protein
LKHALERIRHWSGHECVIFVVFVSVFFIIFTEYFLCRRAIPLTYAKYLFSHFFLVGVGYML